MIDNVGGPQRVNNLLTTLNIPSINNKNLKVMEKRAGVMIEQFADDNMKEESFKAFEKEVGAPLITMAGGSGGQNISDENVDPVKLPINETKNIHSSNSKHPLIQLSGSRFQNVSVESANLPINETQTNKPHSSNNQSPPVVPALASHENVRDGDTTAPDKSSLGMTVCADHGWQKKGFDSLTGG
ncbi:uncharacterized protein LOC123560237 isoform X2 [Mercenaria mercenaria]|nr:uncharacterized protein LOC123560237 isoform X2 [Mercenaria mercenaria]